MTCGFPISTAWLETLGIAAWLVHYVINMVHKYSSLFFAIGGAIPAIPCLCTGLLTNLCGLLVIQFMLGSMDTFVPGQYWIYFTGQVVGTGWGASGAGFIQLVLGNVISPFVIHDRWQ